MALAQVLAEHAATGRVRAMEDVRHPTRLDPSAVAAAHAAGFEGRAVPRFVPDKALASLPTSDDPTAGPPAPHLARTRRASPIPSTLRASPSPRSRGTATST